MPWPSSLVLLSAIAAATTRLRLAACAVIAPLRHPLLLARELGTLDLLSEGRLVVQPTVSWHRDEYEALGVPFGKRGELLDEHLAAWEGLWRDTPHRSPASTTPSRTSTSSRRRGARTGRGSGSAANRFIRRLLRRIVRYAHGFHPLGQPSDDDLTRSGKVSQRPAATSRSSSSSAACGPSSPTTTVLPRSAGDRVGSGPARARLHDVLYQAVAVRRRVALTRPGAARSSSASVRSAHERRGCDRRKRRCGNCLRDAPGPGGTGLF